VRRRRAWWGRRPWREKSYPNAHALHDYEDDVILRKVRVLQTPSDGIWVFTPSHLMNTHPDLFNERNLRRALKRMRKDGKIGGGGKFWGRKNPMYELNELPEAKAA
jgi:hypothetical protein